MYLCEIRVLNGKSDDDLGLIELCENNLKNIRGEELSYTLDNILSIQSSWRAKLAIFGIEVHSSNLPAHFQLIS